MCGITGKIFFDKNRKVEFSELKRMTDVIEHRGPDDEGHYIDQNIGLGFRRLSIIDLEAGHQPLSNQNDSIWITFNGEIYNFQSLRSSLLNKGYVFKTNSDTEVILHLYQEYGEKCVDHLRGMFAFVIWDSNKQELFGARDRFGIKPFNYYMDEEKFVWASEIKSINCVTNVKKDLSLTSLDYYFAYGYTPRNQSIFDQIKKLEPGHRFVLKPFEKNKLSISQYWKVDFEPDHTKSEAYWKEAIFESLDEAVKLRMISDVPLGAFLSGGVDSSTVVAMMSRNSSQPIKTFSIGFKEEQYNELKYAQMVADQYKTDHHEFIVDPESIDLLPSLVKSYDEPFADSSSIATYYVCKYTRQHVTVALSGDGGDELFAGYNRYDKMISLKNRKVKVPWLYGALNKMLPDHMYGKGLSYYRSKDGDTIGAYFNDWKDYERNKFFKDDVKNQLVNKNAEIRKLNMLKVMDDDFLTNMQHLDMQTYMVDDILTKVDRASMSNSLEARVPLLDHKFAELSFKIPSAYKLRNNSKKYILKESIKHIVPPGVISHKKQGFAVPLDIWFKGNLKEYAFDTLTSSNHLYDYLKKDFVKDVLNGHQKGYRDFSQRIWSLLFLDEWLKQNY